ncbi:UNVERIFIED_CONTAM: nucleoside diphosphate kinase [Hammondia hammondi]|eukprot:XP_008882298.1 nucleoside diphosphate kinase [Hammondia hammondi]
MIKPDAVGAGACEQIRDAILDSGLDIIGEQHLRLSESAVDALYEEHKDKPFYDDLRLFLTGSDGVVVLILEGQGACRRWKLLCGPRDSVQARQSAKGTLRARFGADATRNAVHGASCAGDVEKAISLFFAETDFALERTFALIKPDGMDATLRRSIFEEIEKKRFQIISRKEIVLEKRGIMQLYAKHQGESYFPELMEFMTSRPVTALVLMRVGAVASTLRRREAKQSRRLPSSSPSCRSTPSQMRSPSTTTCSLNGRHSGKQLNEPSARDPGPPTLQILISKGLEALCAVKPQGLAAVSWLADWLEGNCRCHEGEKHLLLESPAPPKRKLIRVQEGKEMPHVLQDSLPRPPFFVRIVGGPLSGKRTLGKKIADETGFLALSFKDVTAKEIADKSALGQMLEQMVRVGGTPSASVEARVWTSAFLENSERNRFVLSSSLLSVEHAKKVDRELGAAPTIVVFLDCPRDLLLSRGSQTNVSGMLSLEEKIDESLQQMTHIKDYYQRLGKVCVVDGTLSPEAIFQQVKHLFLPVVTYVLAAPGLPIRETAKNLEGEGAHYVDVHSLLRDRARGDASLTHMRYRTKASIDHFVITDFPMTVKQMRFVEEQVSCTVRAIRIRATESTLKSLQISETASLKAMEMRRKAFRSQDMNAVFADLEARGVLHTIDCDVLRDCPLAAANRSVGRRLCDLLPPLGPRATVVVGPFGYDTTPLALALSKFNDLLFLDCDALKAHALEMGDLQTLPEKTADSRFFAHAVQQALHRNRRTSAVLVNLPRTWGDAELRLFDESVTVERVVCVRGAPQIDPLSRTQEPELHVRFVKTLTQFYNRKLKVIEVTDATDGSAEDLATEIVRESRPAVVALAAPPTVDTRNVAKSLCDACRYKLLPDVETLIRAKMPELSQKKLKAILDSPERLAAVLAKVLEADAELQAASGCLLVGYPATVAQASTFLKEGAKFERLVQVSLPMEEVLQRLEEDEDQPEVDREEVERALNTYYANEEALRRFFEPRGQLVTLDGTSPTAQEACLSAFAPRVLLFPSAHLRPSFANEIAAMIAQKVRARVVDVAEFHTPDARGQAPDEDVFRDLATAEPRDLVARQSANAEVTALLLAELRRSSTEVLLVCGFPFAPLDSDAGLFAQILQLRQACNIDGLLLLDVPASSFETFGIPASVVETLGLSIPQLVQHSHTVNDLLLSVLGESVKNKVRLTLRTDQTLKELRATLTAELGLAAEPVETTDS